MNADRRRARIAAADGQEGRGARSERILDAAIELFRAHGYHSVGIDEIGAKAGISGPGIYRHFPSKPSLLVELFTRVSDTLVAESRRLAESAGSPQQLLDELIAFHVAFALGDRSLIAVYQQEARNLPADATRPLRRRQRQYMEYWTSALSELRPDLDDDQVVDAAYAAIALISSVATHEPRSGRDSLERLLTTMTRRALLEP